MADETRSVHSPLGASSAERWMKCPGSVTLIQALGMDESDEEDWRREGVAGHEAAAWALRNDLDAWELVGETFNNTVMSPELVDPIQTYLDYTRSLTGVAYIEYGISSPVHPLFYGTADFAALNPGLIHVVDLKMGEGIMVEAEENPQLKYYAFGFVDGMERSSGKTIDDDVEVRLTIVQPRGYREDKIREWSLTVQELKAWVHGVLVPAMLATEYDDTLDVGEHCRFCPAKLVCPLMTSLFGAAAKANPKHVVDLSDEQLGRDYDLVQAVKFYIKAQEAEVLNRLMKGRDLGGPFLVKKKANRIYKPGAEDLAKAKFGKDAMTPPALKSPAELERTVPAAKAWVKEFAYSPDTGLTVAPAGDARIRVSVTPPTERFSAVSTGEDA